MDTQEKEIHVRREPPKPQTQLLILIDEVWSEINKHFTNERFSLAITLQLHQSSKWWLGGGISLLEKSN